MMRTAPVFFGNDVVDLEDARRRPWGDRALRRLFRDEELAGLEASRHIEQISVLWASKEAAYKAVKRCRPETGFVPQAFVVAPDDGSVLYTEAGTGDRLMLGLKITRDEVKDYVHAMCCGPRVVRGYAWIRDTGRRGPREESAAVRQTLRRGLGRLLGAEQTEGMEILGGGEVPPVLRLGRDTELPISLSHDGRFVAAAVPVLEPAQEATL